MENSFIILEGILVEFRIVLVIFWAYLDAVGFFDGEHLSVLLSCCYYGHFGFGDRGCDSQKMDL